MTINPQKIKEISERARCLHSSDKLQEALDKMAGEITDQLHDKNPIVMAVMVGALIPVGHLVTRLNFPLEIDYIHATRYRGATRGGDLHWLVEPRLPLEGRTVLIVDDILDTGLTLEAIIDYCKQAGAKEVYTAVMVNKLCERESHSLKNADFSGVDAENIFLYGFGLDYDEYLRNVDGIYAVAEEDQ